MTVAKLSLELMIYVLIGLYLQKRHIVDDHFERHVSSLLLEVVLPLMIVRSMQMEITSEDLHHFGSMLLLGIGWLVFSLLVGQVLWSLCGKGATGRIIRYACAFTNFTIIGLPVISAVYDQQTTFYFTLFVIPMRIAMYALSELLMSPGPDHSGARPSIWRKIGTSPPLVAVAVGAVLCLAGLKIPEPLDSVMKNMSALSLPLGMMLCGLIAGKFPVKKILSVRALEITVLRDLVFPGILLLFCGLCGVSSVVTRVAVIYAALPVGSLLATFATQYDGSEKVRYESAGTVIVSTVASAVTVPLWVGIMATVI